MNLEFVFNSNERLLKIVNHQYQSELDGTVYKDKLLKMYPNRREFHYT